MKKVTENDILIALLCNGSPTAAAQELGISPNTVFKRIKNPKFVQKYRECQEMQLQSALSTMKVRISEALDTLSEVMNNKKAPYSDRVRAADTMLRHCRGYIEVVDITKRLVALENKENETGG